MKKIIIYILALFIITVFTFNYNLKAEIVNLQKDDKKFGDFKVFCEKDVMMNATHCQIGAKFFDNASSFTIEPNKVGFNQLMIVIPSIKLGGFVQIRIDQNDLIFSKIAKQNNFGLIEIEDNDKISLFKQMKTGDFLFFRFKIKESDKEITTKLNLNDFRSALNYCIERSYKN